jgi:hypothetical protein
MPGSWQGRRENKVAPQCRAFDISRVTGRRILDRQGELGLDGAHDRSEASHRQVSFPECDPG